MPRAAKAAKAVPTSTAANEAPFSVPPVDAVDFAMSDGVITRKDKDGSVEVAYLDETTLKLVEDQQQHRPAVIAFLNEKGIPYEAIIIEGDGSGEVSKNAPPIPKKDMRFGDKTPARVEWYKKWSPAQYRARYGIVGPGTVTKTRTEIDEKTGAKVKVPYEADAILSHRKIKGTEKVEAGNATNSEYNDK